MKHTMGLESVVTQVTGKEVALDYYDPNPKSKGGRLLRCNNEPSGDCAIRAVVAIRGLPWKNVYSQMYKLGKRLGTLPNNVWVISEYLEEFCQYKTTCKLERYRISVAGMICKFHEGKYLISNGHHIFCVEDGIIYDTYNRESKVDRSRKVERLLASTVVFVMCDSDMFSKLAKELAEMTDKNLVTEDKFLLNKKEDSDSTLAPMY